MKSASRRTFLILSALGILYFASCEAGTSSVHRHRITSLDDLKDIDTYVATGLPLFEHGFFVGTANGPILVKAKEEGGKANKPRLNPGYYSTLPRLIPAGFEGISISHFNLGSAFPAQLPSIINHHHHPSFIPQQQGIVQPSPAEHRSEVQEPARYAVSEEVEEGPVLQPQAHTQNFIQHLQSRQDRYLHQTHPHSSPVAQATFQVDNFLTGEEEEFEDSHLPTSYQRTRIEHQPHRSQRLIRNPTVEQALELDESLPEDLKNPFYKNEVIATALAQESLPVEGETVVGEWDTSKIQKRRIDELLRSAGLLLR